MKTTENLLKNVTIGSVVNYYNSIHSEDRTFVVIGHNIDEYGHDVVLIDVKTFEKMLVSGNNVIDTSRMNGWTTIKAN